MSDQNPAQALPPLSSSEVLEVLYGRRKRDLSRRKTDGGIAVRGDNGELGRTQFGVTTITIDRTVCWAPQLFTSH